MLVVWESNIGMIDVALGYKYLVVAGGFESEIGFF